jgi:hypothetical protein
MYLNERQWRNLYRLLFDNLPVQNYLKQGDDLSPLLSNFASEYANRNGKYSRTRWDWKR